MKFIYKCPALLATFICLLILLTPGNPLQAQSYYSDFPTPAGNYSTISPSGGVCLAPAFTGTANVADASLTNYASVTGLLSATLLCTNTTYSIRAKLNFNGAATFAPAGFNAGFTVQFNTALSVSLLQSNMSIRTYLAGTLRQTVPGANLAGISLLSATSPVNVYFVSGLSFDEVELVFNTAVIPVGVAFDYRFYNAFAIASVLPVKLKSFTARAADRNAVLNWTTTTEVNVQQFDIEQQNAAGSFTKIGTIPAKGNSSTETDYQFSTALLNPEDYFRLKIVDKDGSVAYSRTVSVKNARLVWTVYPTVVKRGSNIQVQIGDFTDTRIRLSNMQGQALQTMRATGTNQQISTGTLSPGVYVLDLYRNGTRLSTRKVVVE
jgi:hypothetical protein